MQPVMGYRSVFRSTPPNENRSKGMLRRSPRLCASVAGVMGSSTCSWDCTRQAGRLRYGRRGPGGCGSARTDRYRLSPPTGAVAASSLPSASASIRLSSASRSAAMVILLSAVPMSVGTVLSHPVLSRCQGTHNLYYQPHPRLRMFHRNRHRLGRHPWSAGDRPCGCGDRSGDP